MDHGGHSRHPRVGLLTGLELRPHFLDLPADLRDPGRAAVRILPVPYERTSSYAWGSARAVEYVLAASAQVETWDEELQGEPCRAGIATLGPLEVPEGTPEEGIAYLLQALAQAVEEAPFLAVLGGEHSITPPCVEAHVARHGDLTVLQLDAHADLRDNYEGSPWSHAAAMRRVVEHAPVVGVGIRALCREEAEALPELPVTHFTARRCASDDGWIEEVIEALGERVYLTLDMDALDPSIAPSVGTPEPGGLGWWQVIDLLDRVGRTRRVVGMDLVECNPATPEDRTAFLAARLLYKALGRVALGE